MSVEKVTVLRCDDERSRDCLRTFSAVVGTNDTRQLAFRVGWRYSRKENEDACPACGLAR